jgi:hypothetical protein
VTKHDAGCPAKSKHSDAARHACDAVNLHISALGFDACRKWVAVRLRDGRSDGVLYDSKRDAVRHQYDEKLCAYVCIPPNGMTPCRAESFLSTMRRLYDAGWRLVDPDASDGGPDLIPRSAFEDQARVMSALGKG